MDVKLPPLGEGADSGTVVSILVKEGDQIKKGQIILELETGKAVSPIPSPAAGQVIKVLVKEGSKISVGTPILSLSGDGAAAGAAPASEAPKKAGAAPAKAPKARKPAPVEEAEEAEEEGEEAAEESDIQFPPPASPSLRRLAQDLGINLRKIRGSEAGGRIVLSDLKEYIARLQKLAAKALKPAAAAAGQPGAPVKPAPVSIDFSKWGPVTKKPMTGLRKVISQRMTENWTTIPHVTQFEDIDITDLDLLRKKHAPAFEQKGARLTLTSFALKILANTLKKHPIFNSSLDELHEEIVFKDYIHIGMAVDTDQGLIVPVIRDVDKKDLVQLSKDLNDLAVRTRDRKVGMDELQGGTFTISNQGGIGGAHFTPIVNKPEVGIIGLGRGAKKAVVRGDKIEVRLMLPLCLSYDHRVIDGGSAVRFVNDLKAGFEQFSEESVTL